MEINFDVFRNFAAQSQSEELMIQANDTLAENIGNPELAIFILNSFQTQEVQSDEILIHAMSIVFYRIVNYIWGNLYPDQLDQYNVEVFTHIREQIVLLYLNTPVNYQNFIIDAIRDIIRNEGDNSEDLVTNICELINTQDMHSISFVFQVLEIYSSKLRSNKAEPFYETFIQIWSAIASQIHECFANQPDDDAFLIIQCASDIMNHLLISAEDSLLKPETTELVQFFINLLVIPNDEYHCIQMKKSVLLFFNMILRKDQYKEIQQIFLDSLTQIIPQIFSTIVESKYIGALTALMCVFYTLINQEIFKEWFFSEEFVYELLIPAARLTQNDLEEFESSPNQYIGSSICDIFDDDDTKRESITDSVPRIVCANIIQTMIPQASSLFAIDLAQFSNPLDLEAYLYLIYQGYSHRINLAVSLDDDTYSQIFDLLNNPDLPEFIYPSVLCALQNNLLLKEYEILRAVSSASYEILMDQQNNIITVVSALKLFRKTIKSLASNSELESLITVNELIQRLIEISSEVNTQEVQIVMKNIIDYFGPSVMEFSHDLFATFSEFLINISALNDEVNEQQESELNKITDTLFLLFDNQVDPNERLWFANQIIDLTINIFQELPDSIGIPPMLELCSNVFDKIDIESTSDEFKSVLLKFVQFTISYLSSSEDSIYLFPNFASALTLLMPLIDDELVQNIQAICISVFQSDDDEEELVLAAALIVLADIIIYHEEYINDAAQFAIEIIMQNESEISFVTIYCISVLTSALFKTKGSFAQFIPDEILDFWIGSSDVSTLNNDREIHIFTLGLLYIATQGNNEALKAAGNLLFQSFQKEMIEKQEEEEDLGIIDDEDLGLGVYGDDDLDVLQKIVLPIDLENASKLFIEIADEIGYPEEYPEEFLIWLKERAYKAEDE